MLGNWTWVNGCKAHDYYTIALFTFYWLTSLNMMSSSSSHVMGNYLSCFFLQLNSIPFHIYNNICTHIHTQTPQFPDSLIHSWAFGLFPILTIILSVVMNLGVHTSGLVFLWFRGRYPKVVYYGHPDILFLLFFFLRNPHIAFQKLS